ncbi:hypothetical protein B9Q11_02865 [Candidatus Marsarchaeota G2 archaeon ECH_B_SAG-F08]|jgi:ABC-type multidrug transport system, ATPase component|uniref:ABC transporter domain-containing protein n=6 Tax=Candidatus Marsarchaeota TaxID=1978152 RepID=A0A2R6BYK3_9ARCH|nr:MAG: hypothetical protein B9Q01_00285 [Candidatus Marsarchaeota G1 archaeon OSP_D]PSN89691.1 MAG: hypothetical protein B9Q00_00295 [Candidatus Marsarchaeota G1 archaeon OSP_C]PSN98117.1 MAG: hypothetical protein B9Q11_02865 [Candidatus Marsarchaeota G2 archaeon ECH_B_SAG-F08]PSO02771.1 MAG: hypothetical protein B9Q10_00920 [Candidatus Marsarchaeota G2 archaeon ECH_B_SAG-E12]PSO03724.1 MAG: hypothetical protein B9Q12_03945 [Candidatus Marsarchaeota G2 archaeon ECH_B_SAG-G06]PSO04264.1 MAG: h
MIVSISKVSKRYNTLWVLKEVSVKFFSQNVIAVIGRNGEGKSTLVKIVSGVIKADSGRVSIDGEQPHDPRAKARMAVSFQSPSLFSGFSLKGKLDLSRQVFWFKTKRFRN